MSESIYLIGAPGSGKSTILGHLMKDVLEFTAGREDKICRETTVTWMERGGTPTAWMWGRFRDRFPGTDALGMAASRYAREYLEEGHVLPGTTFGEGVRLANIRFLLTLDSVSRLGVVFLDAPEDVLQERREARDGDFSQAFKRGALTRAKSLREDLTELGIYVTTIQTEEMSSLDNAYLIAETLSRRGFTFSR